ncbi:MAG: hypothetical protein ACI35P_15360 [Bacillus sp. (in: firmicutes)]
MARTNLNFHYTFKPERQYISSLLSEVENCNGLDVQDISNQTGIPTGKSSGKVEPTLSYAEYMGLLTKEKRDGKYDIGYTVLGECIKDEDTGLLEKLSLLAMHCMLVRPFNGAELWSHIFHNVFPKYRNKLTQKQFEKEIEIQFGTGVVMSPFKGCYQDLFGSLNLIDENADQIILNSSKIDSDFVYLYALTLFTYWDEWLDKVSDNEKKMASTTEITANHLSAIGFRNPFGWSEKDEYQVLELMANKGLIVLNRQMVPFTVRRTTDLESIIDALYSELC